MTFTGVLAFEVGKALLVTASNLRKALNAVCDFADQSLDRSCLGCVHAIFKCKQFYCLGERFMPLYKFF